MKALPELDNSGKDLNDKEDGSCQNRDGEGTEGSREEKDRIQTRELPIRIG